MSKLRPSQPGPVDPAQGLFEQNDQIDVLNLFGALRRYKWMIATITVIGAILGIIIGKNIEPTYRANAAVVIEPPPPVFTSPRATSDVLETDQETIATQVRLLQQRTYHQRVMEDLRLFDDPEFNPALQEEASIFDVFPLIYIKEPALNLMAQLPPSVQSVFGMTGAAAPEVGPEVAYLSREKAITAFGSNVRISNDGLSLLINIGFIASEPVKAAHIANRFTEIYVNDRLTEKTMSANRATVWIEEQLANLELEVQRADEALATAQIESGVIGGQGQTINQQELSDLNRELFAARSELAEKQAKLSLIRDLQRAGGSGLDSLADVVNSPIIIDLRRRETDLARTEAQYEELYGPRHPLRVELAQEKQELQGRLNAEINRVVRTFEGDLRITRSRIVAIESQLQGVRSATEVDRTNEVALDELERRALIARQQYERMLEQYRDARTQESVVQPDVRIVTKAQPPTAPNTPGSKIFGGAGFMLCFCLSVLVAIVLDRMDKGIRSAREVEKVLGLQTIGFVPKLDKLKRNQKPYQYLMEKPLSSYAEAVRSVFTAIKLSNVDKEPKVVLVTSSLPQEGKSTLASSLAAFAARSQKRVLLIDLDLRHPSVHRVLGWQVAGGLVEFMANERSLEEVIHHDLETGMHFLPIKGQTTNPTDLLDSQRMRLLIDHCRETYDYVVIDSAPLASVTDTRVAALLADRVVFAVRWGSTIASAAQDSVQALRDVGIEPAGAVITQVDLKRHALYGYGDVGEYYSQSQKYYVN